MSFKGFWKGLGKGVGKGVAWVFRHPEVLEGIIDAAQERKLLNDRKTLTKLGVGIAVGVAQDRADRQAPAPVSLPPDGDGDDEGGC